MPSLPSLIRCRLWMLLLPAIAMPASAQPPRLPPGVRAELDLSYAGTENPRQKLDLLLPQSRSDDTPLPVIAFIHGGGWRGGDKRGGIGRLVPYVASGEYAGVSVGYRLSEEATWPAQIHDCKAAIRWIRANAGKYNLDPDRIGVMGPSAGGHLVALLGTSGDVEGLEGDLGPHVGTSTRVRCVVDIFGPTDLFKVSRDSEGAATPVSQLLGGPVRELQDAARAASPVTYVSTDDPPFLLIHGTEDRLVPISQSELLRDALREAGVEVALITVEGAGHGDFRNPEVDRRIRQFFGKHLRGQEGQLADERLQAGSQEDRK